MSNVRVFLAAMQSIGYKNEAARLQLNDAIVKTYGIGSKFKITPTAISLFRNSQGTDDKQAHPKLLNSIQQVLKNNNLYENNLSLDENLAKLALMQKIAAILSKYKIKNNVKYTFDTETRAALSGVWQQVNLSTFQTDKILIRKSLRLIYFEKHECKTESLGITTDWIGRLEKKGEFIHIREKRTDVDYAEEADYTYYYQTNFAAQKQKNKYSLTGAAKIVVTENDDAEPHIFMGKTVMQFSHELTLKYDNKPDKFLLDKAILKKQHCDRIECKPDELATLRWLPNIADIIDELRRDENQYGGFAIIVV